MDESTVVTTPPVPADETLARLTRMANLASAIGGELVLKHIVGPETGPHDWWLDVVDADAAEEGGPPMVGLFANCPTTKLASNLVNAEVHLRREAHIVLADRRAEVNELAALVEAPGNPS
jgi:hypothetical protein